MQEISSLQALDEIYPDSVSKRAIWKEIDHINALYRQFIEASPLLILSTHGAKGIDCSPRGDPPGFVRVATPNCIQIPDRRGNNRLDSLRNIVGNPVVGILFLVPNVGETIRVSGEAEILIDAALCQSFAINGKPASSVLSVKVQKAYYQCQKSLVRSRLWDPSSYCARDRLPSAGQMAEFFSAQHDVQLDADRYDSEYDAYLKQTIY